VIGYSDGGVHLSRTKLGKKCYAKNVDFHKI
jgi:hypothetical protein